MEGFLLSIVILGAVVALQLGLRKWKYVRLKRWWDKSQAATKEQRYDEAIDALLQCIKLEPLWMPARTMIAAIYAQTGDLDDAEEQLRMVADLNPKEADAHWLLGLFYAVHAPDRVDEAVGALERALAHNPELREHLHNDAKFDGIREHAAFRALL